MRKLIILAPLLLCGIFQSCKEEAVCTEEFRTIGITIIGDSLTDFYTIRNSSLDTIRLSNYMDPFDNYYPVLDDNYTPILGNSQESFTFIGERNDTIVVHEQYIIKADDCHIDKVSGKNEVIL